MKIKAVILNHNQPQTVKALYDLLHTTFDVTVFNVGSGEFMSPACPYELFPNLYYTGCWRESIRRFYDFDALWVIGGDVVALNTAREYRDALESSLPFGFWSPSFCGYSRSVMQHSVCGGKTWSVYHLEGIALAISNGMMEQLKFDIPMGNVLGWGLDFWMCWKCWSFGKRSILDGRVALSHPEKCGYSRKDAYWEMVEFLKNEIGDDWQEEIKMSSQYGSFFDNVICEVKL